MRVSDLSNAKYFNVISSLSQRLRASWQFGTQVGEDTHGFLPDERFNRSEKTA